MKEKTCCFIGHRDIVETEELNNQLCEVIENLIVKSSVNTFLFGSKSDFNSLCYDLVTEIKEKYPQIKRIFVRAEYPIINDSYLEYLHMFYEDTYYPEEVEGAGKAAYVKRNCKMIDESNFCVFYYNKDCLPKKRSSGTDIALVYAKKKGKHIFILP